MRNKFVLLSVLCALVAAPAAGSSLLATSAAANGDGLAGAGHRVKRTVYVRTQIGLREPGQMHPETVVLLPISHSYSIIDKITSIFGGITNVIVSKTSAIGEFFRALCGSRPHYILVQVPANTTTTTSSTTTTTENPTTKTTKCPKTTTTTTKKPTIEHTTTEKNPHDCGKGRCDTIF